MCSALDLCLLVKSYETQSKPNHIYIYIHMCVCIYIYIYVHICVFFEVLYRQILHIYNLNARPH